ncbi:MAG: Hsp20/alpha crystallin family protein [Leptospiraceae bacterium]|nr:Hsp20/alpha crystallin family protein [Leptospiraceae bacterium]
MGLRDIIPWGKGTEKPVEGEKTLSPFDALHREINRVFDHFFDDFYTPTRYGLSSLRGASGFYPKFNISENEKEINLEVELPGLEEKDVEVSVDKGILTVKGEKKFQKEEKNENYHLVEHSYGSFQRSLQLPENANVNEITAKMKNGVMKITVPKDPKAETSVKKIAIKSE